MERVVARGDPGRHPTRLRRQEGQPTRVGEGIYASMRRMLATEHGQAISRRRIATVEPVIGQIKFNRGFARFPRRGRSAVRSEWQREAATHNLMKLHRHRVAAGPPDGRPGDPPPQPWGGRSPVSRRHGRFPDSHSRNGERRARCSLALPRVGLRLGPAPNFCGIWAGR